MPLSQTVQEINLESDKCKIPTDSTTTIKEEYRGNVNHNFEDDGHNQNELNTEKDDNVECQINVNNVSNANQMPNIIIIIKDKLELELEAQKQDNDNSNNNNTTLQTCKKFMGILFTLISAIGFSLTLVVTKLIPNLHPITQTIWAQVVNTIISMVIIIGLQFAAVANSTNEKQYDEEERQRGIWKGMVEFVVVEGGGGSRSLKIHWKTLGKLIPLAIIINIGLLSKVTALNYLSIADATVMKYLSLIFVIVLSHFVLHEKCLIVQSTSAGLIIAGAFIIARPPFLTGGVEFDNNTMVGLGIKLLEGLSSALYYIGMRHLRSLHFASTILIINVVGLLLATFVSIGLGLFTIPKTDSEILYCIVLGVLSAIAHNTFLLGLKFERASTVSLIRCADVPFAFLWQILIFQLWPGIWTLTGTLFVCTGVLITSFSKLIAELPKESRARAILGFLLK